MKKLVSAILVCVLLVGTLFTLASCGKSVSGKYEYDGLTQDQTIEFELFGKVTLTIKPLYGDSKVYEGKYELNDAGDEITLTFEDEDANKAYGGTKDFVQGQENDKKYIEIDFMTYKFVE